MQPTPKGGVCVGIYCLHTQRKCKMFYRSGLQVVNSLLVPNGCTGMHVGDVASGFMHGDALMYHPSQQRLHVALPAQLCHVLVPGCA
jgi:hypothetical protein